MRIDGEWLLCDDGILRPVIRGEILASDGTWQRAEFLVDTGADRTVFSAPVLASLRLQPVVTQARLGGVGGEVNSVVVETQVRLTREESGKVVLRGQYAAVTDLQALDMSVLGRDIAGMFAVVVDRLATSSACSANDIIIPLSQDDDLERQGDQIRQFWICDGSTKFILSNVEVLTTGFGFWIEGEKNMNEKSWLRVLNFCSDNPKSAIGKRPRRLKWVGIVAFVLAFVFGGVVVEAQQPKKVARICSLEGDAASGPAAMLKTFRERLRDLGYIEGQNITIEYRHHEGKVERLPSLVAEFVRLNCDVIVTQGTEAAQAAKNATKSIPVVMAIGADAIKLGIVAELARPGGNITGLTDMGAQMYGKRLELLKETVPKLSRVAFLWSPTQLSAADNLKEVEAVARYLRVGVQSLEVKGPDDFDGAFQAATKKRAQALIVGGGGFFPAHYKRIVELAAKSRLPAMYVNTRHVDAGGLMSYGADRSEMFRRAAEIVDKILKGTKPADIPVERPKKFDLVINLKAAKQIDLTVPSEVLARASRIIR